MLRTFPMYKGQSLDRAGMGYSNKASARQYMNDRPVRKDFDKSLPKGYWLNFIMIKKHAKGKGDKEWSWNRWVTLHKEDYDAEWVYVKDIEEEEVKKHAIAFFKAKKDDDEAEHGIWLDKHGWYTGIYRDQKDYWKRYRKFLKENVEFVEKEVKVSVE